MLSVVSRALSTSSSGSLSLLLELKPSTCSLLGDSGGRLASSFALAGSLLLFEILSTSLSEFKLTGFKTVALSCKFRGKVPHPPFHCIILSYISLPDGFTMHLSPRPHLSLLIVSGYLLWGWLRYFDKLQRNCTCCWQFVMRIFACVYTSLPTWKPFSLLLQLMSRPSMHICARCLP